MSLFTKTNHRLKTAARNAQVALSAMKFLLNWLSLRFLAWVGAGVAEAGAAVAGVGAEVEI